jgi:hypothetical protein
MNRSPFVSILQRIEAGAGEEMVAITEVKSSVSMDVEVNLK